MGIQKASCASGSLRCPPWSSWTVPPRPTFVRTSPALCPSKNPRSYAGCSWTGPRRWRATDIWRTSCVLQIYCFLTLLSVNTKAVESSALLLIWASAVPCRSKKKNASLQVFFQHSLLFSFIHISINPSKHPRSMMLLLLCITITLMSSVKCSGSF